MSLLPVFAAAVFRGCSSRPQTAELDQVWGHFADQRVPFLLGTVLDFDQARLSPW